MEWLRSNVTSHLYTHSYLNETKLTSLVTGIIVLGGAKKWFTHSFSMSYVIQEMTQNPSSDDYRLLQSRSRKVIGQFVNRIFAI